VAFFAVLEAHFGADEAYSEAAETLSRADLAHFGATEAIRKPCRLVLELWSAILEPWRPILEPWRPILEPGRLIYRGFRSRKFF
jgi:hypothetical protein